MMPKGVEHPTPAEIAIFALGVPPAVMPKGVEHYAFAELVQEPGSRVPPPVMPKGVEHLDFESRDLARATASRPR